MVIETNEELDRQLKNISEGENWQGAIDTILAVGSDALRRGLRLELELDRYRVYVRIYLGDYAKIKGYIVPDIYLGLSVYRSTKSYTNGRGRSPISGMYQGMSGYERLRHPHTNPGYTTGPVNLCGNYSYGEAIRLKRYSSVIPLAIQTACTVSYKQRLEQFLCEASLSKREE